MTVIQYRPEELRSLQSRIQHLADRLYKASDTCKDRKLAQQLKLDIYFLYGMRQLIDVLLEPGVDIYPRLHEETTAVEETFINFMKNHGLYDRKNRNSRM